MKYGHGTDQSASSTRPMTEWRKTDETMAQQRPRPLQQQSARQARDRRGTPGRVKAPMAVEYGPEMTRRLWVGTATAVAALTFVLTGCTNTPEPGPLSIGSGDPEPHMVTCTAELGAGGSFLAGDRLNNPTTETAHITSAALNEAEGLRDVAILGRLMPADDPHFLNAGNDGETDPTFARALKGTVPLEGMTVPPGGTIGIVVAATLEDDFGGFRSISLTYDIDGNTFRNTNSASFQGAARECPE